MWNLISSSKLTQERERRKSQEIHRHKLQHMQPVMRIKQPQIPQFISKNGKMAMTRMERCLQIEKQNGLLLQKIEGINDTKYDPPKTAHNKLLNLEIRKQSYTQIYEENKRICEKLLRVASFYPTQTLINQTEELQRVKTNISFNARRTSLRPFTARSTNKFYKSKPMNFEKTEMKTDIRMEQMERANESRSRPQTAPTKRLKSAERSRRRWD